MSRLDKLEALLEDIAAYLQAPTESRLQAVRFMAAALSPEPAEEPAPLSLREALLSSPDSPAPPGVVEALELICTAKSRGFGIDYAAGAARAALAALRAAPPGEGDPAKHSLVILEREFWETNIRDEAERAGIDHRGTVGCATLHMLGEKIESLQAQLAEAQKERDAMQRRVLVYEDGMEGYTYKAGFVQDLKGKVKALEAQLAEGDELPSTEQFAAWRAMLAERDERIRELEGELMQLSEDARFPREAQVAALIDAAVAWRCGLLSSSHLGKLARPLYDRTEPFLPAPKPTRAELLEAELWMIHREWSPDCKEDIITAETADRISSAIQAAHRAVEEAPDK